MRHYLILESRHDFFFRRDQRCGNRTRYDVYLRTLRLATAASNVLHVLFDIGLHSLRARDWYASIAP